MFLRRAALALPALALAFLPALAHADDQPLNPAQTEAVNKLIHDYLVNNPKVLIEALEHAEASIKQDEQDKSKNSIAAHREELNADPTSPVLGNPEGDVTIVEFFDYRCPYCKVSAPVLASLLDQDKKVRLVLKEFPILGKESVFASRVALVAQKHGKYAEFHKAMFALKVPVNDDRTLEVAKSVGLDPAQVKKEMESEEIDKILKHNIDLAQALGVNGTPGFVIGDTLVPGAVDLKDLQAAVSSMRKS